LVTHFRLKETVHSFVEDKNVLGRVNAADATTSEQPLEFHQSLLWLDNPSQVMSFQMKKEQSQEWLTKAKTH
jgi:hypothetical protein